MPTRWVEPEVCLVLDKALDHIIYHAYKDGDAERRLTYWYNTSCCEDPTFEFDIRELQEWLDAPDRSDHVAILRAAYANGHLEFEGGYPDDDGANGTAAGG